MGRYKGKETRRGTLENNGNIFWKEKKNQLWFSEMS